MQFTMSIVRALAALAAGLLVSLQAEAVVLCASAGAFIKDANQCCVGLWAQAVPNGGYRCQAPGCKRLNEVAQVRSDGISDCCFGLVPVPDGKVPTTWTCKVPTLVRSACALLGQVPTSTKPCCVGLIKSSTTLTCERATLTAACNSQQITSTTNPCCFPNTVNRCSCYCPSPYYADEMR